jgi:SAM-dependent methyltransferase
MRRENGYRILPGRLMSDNCELCRQETLDCVYQPDRSSRGLKVYLCRHCGLVQSLPRISRAARAPAAVSSGADWGNVRYGKGFRTKAALDALARHTDLSAPLKLLDVGSNRGSFARSFLDAAPDAHITAVEPDERFYQSCAGLPRTDLIHGRIENVTLQSGQFDIVHSCHTIEHLADPMRALKDHARCLEPGGILVMDAPNLALVGGDDILEEWFIDKHLYHFTRRTLGRMMEAAGFTIIQQPDPADLINLLFVGKANGRAADTIAADDVEADAAEDLITAYKASRARNLAALTQVSAELASFGNKRIALWGAGRLFDSLVLHGNFDTRSLSLLIDTHLKAHVGERHGVALATPDALDEHQPDIIVVMSRGFAAEIVTEAKQRCPYAQILLYSDLISRARMRQAA